jgi:hypothetical protein
MVKKVKKTKLLAFFAHKNPSIIAIFKKKEAKNVNLYSLVAGKANKKYLYIV